VKWFDIALSCQPRFLFWIFQHYTKTAALLDYLGNISARKVLNLSSRMGSSVPSLSCPPRTPRGAWRASSCWYWRGRGTASLRPTENRPELKIPIDFVVDLDQFSHFLERAEVVPTGTWDASSIDCHVVKNHGRFVLRHGMSALATSQAIMGRP
jgi:hypothetical protein